MRTTALIVAVLLLSPLVPPAAAQAPRAMSLADLVAVADQRNPTIAAARQAVLAAEASVALARAGRGPTVTASDTTATAGGGTTTTTPPFSTSVSVLASYVVYDSGQVAYAVRQAEANLKSSRLALEAARQDVSQNVGLAYLAVLRADRAVDQRRQQVVLNQELVRLAEGQFRAGVVPRSDVVRAQAGLALAEGDLLVALGNVDQTKASLNIAVGFGPVSPIVLAAAPPAPPLVTVAQAGLARLVEQRPEIRKALADIEAAEAAVALAQAGGGLRVTLDGRVTQNFAPGTNGTYSLGTTFSLPVSDAGRVAASVAAATANLAAAQARIESTRLTVQQQGVSALLAILSARARIVSARAGLAFAQESLRLAAGRYAAGAGTLIEVTDAQTALVQAEVTLASAEFDELAGVISLRYALGRSVVDGAI